MAKYRAALPQLDGKLFLTDGGMETDLIFNRGVEVPAFAAVFIHKDRAKEGVLIDYFKPYTDLARELNTGFILETNTWRASQGWAESIGTTPEILDSWVRRAVEVATEIRDGAEAPHTPVVISGNIGPRGDGYVPGELMSVDEAQSYHARQADLFASTTVDFISAFTITNTPEAAGIALAAKSAGLPSVISFTVETDGRLPTGQALGEAITEVDDVTGGSPAYYMINCAHPTHFAGVLEDAAWIRRIRGLRANASCKSHAELDESTELDIGDPHELGGQYAELIRRFPHINILGGCCGTDFRHIAEIARACIPREAA